MKSLTINLFMAGLLGISSCANVSSQQALSALDDEAIASSNATSTAIADEGDLVLEYVEPQTSDYTEVYQILHETGFYEGLLSDLNETFALPQDVLVSFDECGEENAFYDPEAVTITMCYELIKAYADRFQAEYGEDYTQEVIYAGFFTFFHELGHALVDQYQLPVVGREEDAVDSFAAVLMLETEEEDAVLAGMEQFDVDAENEAEQDELPFWDEHSLSEQRVYNVSCLIYGSDPDGYADFLESGWLPEDRADRCEAEYAQARNSWITLLEPYLK